MKNFNIHFTFVDSSNTQKIEQAIQPNTKLVWIETPTNPLLKLSDIKAITQLCQPKNIISVIDNTFKGALKKQK